MAYCEIEPTDTTGLFRAFVGCEDDYSAGQILIQPPVSKIGKHLFRLASTDMRYEFLATTDSGTLLDFGPTERGVSSGDFRQTLKEDVTFLLDLLSSAADHEFLKKRWQGEE